MRDTTTSLTITIFIKKKINLYIYLYIDRYTGYYFIATGLLDFNGHPDTQKIPQYAEVLSRIVAINKSKLVFFLFIFSPFFFPFLIFFTKGAYWIMGVCDLSQDLGYADADTPSNTAASIDVSLLQPSLVN